MTTLLKADRLEKILQAYEDQYWFMLQLVNHEGIDTSSVPGPMAARASLQKGDRIDYLTETLANLADRTRVPSENNFWKYLFDTITDIADWVHGSRRVFSVSPDLVNMFLETDLPSFFPVETKFVAPAFVVSLERRIVQPSTFQDVHDFFVFVSEFQSERAFLSIRSYNHGFDTYTPLSAGEKTQLKQMVAKGGDSYKRATSRFYHRHTGLTFTGFEYTCEKDVSYNQILSMDDPELESRKVFFQLCMGLNLYLQSARKGDFEERLAVGCRPSARSRSVVSGAELFSLAVLSPFHRPADNDSLGVGYEVRPHFRRGHWRRPKGFGHDPNAPATEWVRPTWVRKDKMDKGEQPIGSLQKTDVVS